MCPVLGKTLMSPHTHVSSGVPHKLPAPGGAGEDWISCARRPGGALAIAFLAVLMCCKEKKKKNSGAKPHGFSGHKSLSEVTKILSGDSECQ